MVFDARVDVGHPAGSAVNAHFDLRHHRVRPDLRTVRERIGNMCDEWGRFGVDFAAL